MLKFSVASCSDGVQSHDETGVDCGGPCNVTCAPLLPKHHNSTASSLLGGIPVLTASAVGGGVVLLAVVTAIAVRLTRSHRDTARQVVSDPAVRGCCQWKLHTQAGPLQKSER